MLKAAEVDKGGHFAAWERPQLFVQELRAAFKSLRDKANIPSSVRPETKVILLVDARVPRICQVNA